MCKISGPKQPVAPSPVSPTPSPQPVAEVTQDDPNKIAERNNRLAIGTNNLVIARDNSLGGSRGSGSGLGINV